MGKNKELSEADRKSIVVLSESGKSERDIAKQLGKPKTTVHDTLVRLKLHKTLKSLPRCGRKRKTTSRIDRKILTLAQSSDQPNAKNIANQLAELSLADISSQTVRNRLYDNDLHGRTVVKKPLLTKRHIAKRLEFAKQYQNWTVEDWKKVLWSDETKICLHGSDGKRWTWRKAGERLQPKHVKQTIKHDKYVMAWGCFGWNGVGAIHIINDTLTSAKYVRILSDHMVPSAAKLFEERFVFQQDNDPKHTAKNTKKWLESQNIELMEWPPQSPDLNPIENLWYMLKIEIGKLNLKKLDEVPEALKNCWNTISKERCQSLIESMPKRIDELIKNKGLWTKY